MSFYIENVLAEKEFNQLLSEEKIVLVRFGLAEEEETKKIDKILSSFAMETSAYFRIVACEVQDMPETLLKRYRVSKLSTATIVFFHKGKPLMLEINKVRSFYLHAPFPSVNNFLSLLIHIHLGICKNHRKISMSIPGIVRKKEAFLDTEKENQKPKQHE
ncbi:hypothetical protein NEFER03_0035 [Nematocida sp. LUAm3]|nr:hypothetical protein NEFER03_0035 [Nematocida sp. LUAm3]KAI5176251.1 hypothetical protein NEFER02_2048 [Nematocida sp. LUAm2]KAI5176709.1 hypothetical protein NEFER01_0034 [Nematocida sp. LUAm1]